MLFLSLFLSFLSSAAITMGNADNIINACKALAFALFCKYDVIEKDF